MLERSLEWQYFGRDHHDQETRKLSLCQLTFGLQMVRFWPEVDRQ